MRGIYRSPVNSPHKGQPRGALVFSLICARINAWANNRQAGDLRRHQAHYDVIVMPNRNKPRQSGKCMPLPWDIHIINGSAKKRQTGHSTLIHTLLFIYDDRHVPLKSFVSALSISRKLRHMSVMVSQIPERNCLFNNMFKLTIKENIKAPLYWPFAMRINWSQRASYFPNKRSVMDIALPCYGANVNVIRDIM